MGKRHVHVIAVRKPVTFALLVLTTGLMATLLYLLSGLKQPTSGEVRFGDRSDEKYIFHDISHHPH